MYCVFEVELSFVRSSMQMIINYMYLTILEFENFCSVEAIEDSELRACDANGITS